MNKKGFTLAEVLITLGIIGVVAALTIPTILNWTFEREAVSKLKKNYSILQSAVTQWQTDSNCLGNSYDCPEYDAALDNNSGGVARALAPYFKYANVYYTPTDAVGATISWLPDNAYFMNGTTRAYAGWVDALPAKNQPEFGFSSYFLLADGTTLMIAGAHHCYYAVIDINGIKKPNRHGKDLFIASLGSPRHKTLSPYAIDPYFGGTASPGGACPDNSPTIVCNPDDGKSPTAYVLSHDKLPDLIKLGYPSTP